MRSAMQELDAWLDKRFGHAGSRGRTQRMEFGAFLELVRSITTIDRGVAQLPEETLGALRQQHEQVHAGDARLALKCCHEFAAETTFALRSRHDEGTQQSNAPMTLEADSG